ncbi:hypothetical protein BLD44_025215 [Mastigocladus laminosus UU774]|nr:hypothetical protein BLD44_025215 [Mastigocladus laminosus UU774]
MKYNKKSNQLITIIKFFSSIAFLSILFASINSVLAVSKSQNLDLSKQKSDKTLLAGFFDKIEAIKETVEDLKNTVNGTTNNSNSTTNRDSTDTTNNASEAIVYSFNNFSPANNEIIATGSFTIRDDGDGKVDFSTELIDFNITVTNTKTGKKTLLTPSTTTPNSQNNSSKGVKTGIKDVTVSSTVLDFSTASSGMLYLETGDEYNDFFLNIIYSSNGKRYYTQIIGTGDNISRSESYEPFSLKATATSTSK